MSRLLMGLASRAPLAVLHAVGALLGWVTYVLCPTYRRHLRKNLEAAGFRDAATRRAAIAGAGRTLAELPYVWFRPVADLAAQGRRIEGLEHVEAARAAGKGIVFLTPHLGCFEITTLIALNRFPLTILYRPRKHVWLQSLIAEGRERNNVRLARADFSGVRKMVRALSRGEAVGILPDQVPRVGEGERAEFFGKPAYTMTLASKLAHRPKSVCLLIWGERLRCGAGYTIHVRPMPAAAQGESPVRHLNRAIEALVRECPGQYLWGYNRYKQPRGAALQLKVIRTDNRSRMHSPREI